MTRVGLQCTLVHSGFEWDPKKAAVNYRKHGVHFADALSALEDDRAVTLLDDAYGEERWATIGMDGIGRVLVVIYTWRSGAIRIISAREATKTESRQYLENP
jgi:hypothetical protein